MTTQTTKLAVGSRVRIEAGCKARNVAKNCTAEILAIEELGAEYGHQVRVRFVLRNGVHAGTRLSFYAQHVNRLCDYVVNLNDGNPCHKIKISRI